MDAPKKLETAELVKFAQSGPLAQAHHYGVALLEARLKQLQTDAMLVQMKIAEAHAKRTDFLGEHQEFMKELRTKYELDEDKGFHIDVETGEISFEPPLAENDDA